MLVRLSVAVEVFSSVWVGRERLQASKAHWNQVTAGAHHGRQLSHGRTVA